MDEANRKAVLAKLEAIERQLHVLQLQALLLQIDSAERQLRATVRASLFAASALHWARYGAAGRHIDAQYERAAAKVAALKTKQPWWRRLWPRLTRRGVGQGAR